MPGIERIVDYKSGKVDNDNGREVSDLFDVSKGSNRPGVAFQLHFYALLMNRIHPGQTVRYDPCIYSLRSIFTEEPKSYEIASDRIEAFETQLLSLIEEIFNPALPFEPRPDIGEDPGKSVCRFCNFKRLCNRE